MTRKEWPNPPTTAEFNEWFRLLRVANATPADVIVAWACYPHMKKAHSLIADYRKRSIQATFTIDPSALHNDVEKWVDPDAPEPEQPGEDDSLTRTWS